MRYRILFRPFRLSECLPDLRRPLVANKKFKELFAATTDGVLPSMRLRIRISYTNLPSASTAFAAVSPWFKAGQLRQRIFLRSVRGSNPFRIIDSDVA